MVAARASPAVRLASLLVDAMPTCRWISASPPDAYLKLSQSHQARREAFRFHSFLRYYYASFLRAILQANRRLRLSVLLRAQSSFLPEAVRIPEKYSLGCCTRQLTHELPDLLNAFRTCWAQKSCWDSHRMLRRRPKISSYASYLQTLRFINMIFRRTIRATAGGFYFPMVAACLTLAGKSASSNWTRQMTGRPRSHRYLTSSKAVHKVLFAN